MGDEQKYCNRSSLWKNSQGSVSILLIFIVSTIFLFTSVLIDYARIVAVEWRAEVLAQSGIRSVMSAYEPALQKRYQLFAYGQSDPAQIMDYVMRDQVELQATGVFPWVPLLLDSHSTFITRKLGKYDELERQILENMKYKSPVQFTFELLDKLKLICGAMKETAQTTELLIKLKKLVDKRDKEIGHAFKLQKKLCDQVISSGIDRLIGSGRSDIMRDSLLGPIHSVADVGAQYIDYVHKIQIDSQRTEAMDKQYNNETDNYEHASQSLFRVLQSKVFNFRNRHRIILTQVLSHLEKARQYNEDMKQVIQRARFSLSYNSYDQVKDFSNAGAGNTDETEQVSDAIKRINDSAADHILLPESFVADWQREVKLQENAIERVDEAATYVQSMASQIMGISVTALTTSSSHNLKHSVLNLWHAWGQYRYSSKPVDARGKWLEQFRATETKRKKKEKEANSKLRKATNFLSKLKKLDKQLKEHKRLFQEVRDKEKKISNFNALKLEEQLPEIDRQREAIEESRDSMGFITSMYASIASGFGALQDRLYRNEYAFLYFNSYNPQKLKSVFTSNEHAEELLKSLTIHNQEAEYILYGGNNPVSNVAAAFGEILTTRLAIRTMEGLVEYGRLGHPLLILISAIIYGIEQAAQDLTLLVARDEIPVSRYVPSITLSYGDHLRLFMLIHGNREGMLMRMLALIQKNTGVDPTTRGTYGETELRMSTSLWFLPSIIRWISKSRLLGGEVEDGRYYVKKKSIFSYS